MTLKTTTQKRRNPGGATAPATDLAELFAERHQRHLACLERCKALLAPTADLAAAAISVLKAGGKLLLCGNGGSAADCQHIATELTIRFEHQRQALAAIALTTDGSALTAAGNDYGYEQVFARQVEALGRPGDLLIALTTSGNSPNILAALQQATAQGLVTACLTGRDGGAVQDRGLAEHCLVVPDDSTAHIQEAHIFLGHLICLAIDRAFADA